MSDVSSQRLAVERVLRFEHLQDDWQALRKDWALTTYPETLPHANKSATESKGPLQNNQHLDSTGEPWWTKANRERVYATYRKDFEWFGYAEDSWQTPPPEASISSSQVKTSIV